MILRTWRVIVHKPPQEPMTYDEREMFGGLAFNGHMILTMRINNGSTKRLRSPTGLEDLSWVQDPVRVERYLDGAVHVQDGLVQLLAKACHLQQPDTVLTGHRPTQG